MSEVTDMVMPILRKIQDEIAGTRRSLEAKINDVGETTLKVAERLDKVEAYLTYSLGTISRQGVDLEELVAWKREVDARVAALETARRG